MKKITLLFALFAFLSAQAQWTSDTAENTLVSNISSGDAKSVGTSTGGTFIAFWKVVAAPTNYELWVQYLDADGNRQFGDDGMLVSNTIPMSTSTLLWKTTIDKNDNFYISITGSATGNPAFIFKITTAGTLPWGENGISIGAGYVPTLLPLSNGEVVVSYWPGSQKAKLRKYSAAGEAIWENPIDIVGANTSSATIPADLYELSNGDIEVVFHQKFTFGVASNLYAQKFNSEGVSQWTAPIQLSDKGTSYNALYSGTQDGDIIYYGFSGATGNRYDSYVQRINPDGTTPWGLNGMDFDTNQTNYEMDTKIAFESGSDYVWAISRYTQSSQDLQGEYVQKFDKNTGERQFSDNAKSVFPISDAYRNHISDLFLTNDSPVFLIKSGFDNGVSPVTLNAVLLNSDGEFAWEEEFLPMATFASSKGRITFNRPVADQAAVVFIEEKTSGATKIYAQNLTNALLLAADNFTSEKVATTLYPNPTNGLFTIQSDENIKSVTVYNSSGKMVYTTSEHHALTANIDSKTWSTGFYFVKITNDKDAQKTVKFIKN